MSLDFTGFETIPFHTRDALERYAEHRIPPGGFLRAVLGGDLYSAIERADYINFYTLPEIARFIQQKLPGNIWGNAKSVENHLDGLS